jgi:putative ABC transport system permease protein
MAELHLSPAGDQPLSPRGDRTLLAALAAIAILITVSASFNFVALMTARSAQRAIETGVRKAAGARRRQLIVQFLGESVLYVALAMLLALALTEVLLPAMNAILKQRVAFHDLSSPAWWGGLLAATAAVGVLAGIHPAFVLSAFRPAAVLKGALLQGTGGGILRRVFVALQFAIMIGLGIAAVTIWRQTRYSLDNQLRVDGSSILLIDGACEDSGRAFRERVAMLPGVSGAACAGEDALRNGGMIISAQVQGGSDTPMVSGGVDYGTLELYGLRPLAGRFFDRNHGDDGILVQGDATGNPSIVINETAMHKLGFSSASAAIGKTVIWNRRRWSPNPTSGTVGPSEIIGVSPDLGLDTRRPTWPQIVYIDPASLSALSVRLMGSQIPEALTAIDATWSQVMHRSIHRRFLSQNLREMYADIILQGRTISMGAAIAGVIATLGLFGLSAQSAQERTKEIGIRKAMGASRKDVLRMLLWQFAKPGLWANLIALPVAAYVMDRWLEGFTRHIGLSPLAFVAVGAVALCVALITVAGHAILIARARPVVALRYE